MGRFLRFILEFFRGVYASASTTTAGAATVAVIAGGGTSASPVTTSAAGKNFLGFWTKSTATSGDSRGFYGRHYISGSGGAGEAVRAFTTVETDTPATTSSVHGAHSSLSFGASAGKLTSTLGVAQRSTLQLPARDIVGTAAAIQAEIWSESTASTSTGTLSIFRAVNAGNATGMGNVDSNGNFLELSGLTAGAGKLLETSRKSLRVKDGSTTMYLPMLPALTGGQVFGVGTSSAYHALGATAGNALEFYLASTATTGTARGLYNRLKLSSGAGGEAARNFTTVENNAPVDTVNGAHNSLNFGASAGNITGLGTASRNTLHGPNRSLGGTAAAVQAEVFSDGTASAYGGAISLVRLSNAGNATGKGNFDSTGFVFDLDGFTAGSSNAYRTGLNATTMAAATTCAIRIRLPDGSSGYIPIATATA